MTEPSNTGHVLPPPGRTLAIGSSYLFRALRRALRDPSLLFGALLTALVVGVGGFAPVLAPHDPLEPFPGQRLHGMSGIFPLGSDELGRDVSSRVVYGTRISLAVAVGSTAFALAVGGTLGVVAGYRGGFIDHLLMRIVDVIFAIPALILAIAVAGILGPSLVNTVMAIGVAYLPRFSRVSRAAVLTVKPEEYVEAARAIGATHARIIGRHLVPNALAPIIVQTTYSLSTAIVAEATLSFLGVGVQPPVPSLGNMLHTGRLYIDLSPVLALAPGLAITVATLGFNMLGDGLRDLLDPRIR